MRIRQGIIRQNYEFLGDFRGKSKLDYCKQNNSKLKRHVNNNQHDLKKQKKLTLRGGLQVVKPKT